jgi:hypothetical protein
MPFTFLPHQAPVVPLKIVAPRWFDGTALVIGSMVPDLVYFTDGSPFYVDAHTVLPQLWFCLPLTVVATIVCKRVVAGPLGAHLPDLGRFHLRDFARLSAWRVPRSFRGWATIVVSALIGSFSHIALDSMTHSYGFVTNRVDVLQQELFTIPYHGGHVIALFDVLQVVLSIVGALITIWCLWYIGTRRLVRRWYPTAVVGRPTVSSRRCVVRSTVVGALVGLVVAIATVDVGPKHVSFFRVVDLAFVGLGVGCALAASRMTPAEQSADAGADLGVER